MKIAADVEARGGRFVDTPMTRTPNEAEAGKLALMVGGPADVLARIRPVLDCFADTIVHTGAVGSAHRLKLINNFLAICHAAAAAEAITVAAKAGVDMEALRAVVMAGGAASTMFGRMMNAVARRRPPRAVCNTQRAQGPALLHKHDRGAASRLVPRRDDAPDHGARRTRKSRGPRSTQPSRFPGMIGSNKRTQVSSPPPLAQESLEFFDEYALIRPDLNGS